MSNSDEILSRAAELFVSMPDTLSVLTAVRERPLERVYTAVPNTAGMAITQALVEMDIDPSQLSLATIGALRDELRRIVPGAREIETKRIAAALALGRKVIDLTV